MQPNLRLAPLVAAVIAACTLSACNNNDDNAAITAALQSKVKNIVVIYAENRSFDNTFGNFPGANGLSTVVNSSGVTTSSYIPQKDRDGVTVLATLPQTWNGNTAAGNTQVVTQAKSANLPNAPFPVETAFTAASGVTLTTADGTRDPFHRCF